MAHSTFTLRLPVLVGIVAVSLALSGCASPEPAANSTTSSGSTASASASAASSPTPTPTATPAGTPVTVGCNEILTLQNVYDYNPNYGANPTFRVPDQITPLTKIGGVACGWVNQTSGDTFAVGIAKPDAATKTQAANQAATSYKAVPTYGNPPIEGFFGVESGVGVATVFANGYWIVVTSSTFIEPGDAAELVENVLANVR